MRVGRALYADALDFARSLNPGERISTRQLVKKCSTDTATAEQLLQMLEKASLVSMYKPDRRSRVVLQEPEPEADETCMSETSADDESVAGGRSVAGTPAKPSPGGRSAHGSQTPSSASKPRGAASCVRASRTQNVPRLVPLEELRSAASSRQAPGRAHAPTHAHTHASHRAGARTGAQAHLQGFEHLGDDRVRRRQAGGPEVPGLEAVTRSARCDGKTLVRF